MNLDNKKEKTNSGRQFSNPKNSLMKRNNSEIYKTLYNNKIMNLISKSKFNSNGSVQNSQNKNLNSNQKKSTNVKRTIVKESINLYSEVRKDLFSPPKNIEINLSKQTAVSRPHAKQGSITSRKIESSSKNKNGVKNLTSDLKKATHNSNSNSLQSGTLSQRYLTIKK